MYQFIINPNSRTGFGKRIWQKLEPILKQRAIQYEAHFTEIHRRGTEIARELTKEDEKQTLVVLGGDGTLNEVINGIADFSKVTVGYIPTGSGNDFARSLGLPKNPLTALENILAAKRFEELDIGILSYHDQERRFAVSVGTGFDGAVCHQTMKSKFKKALNMLKVGKLIYVGVALSQLCRMRTEKATIILDGSETKQFDATYFVTIMNLQYEGGGFKFCPAARADDGYLDVIVVANLTKLRLLLLLPTAFSGKHVKAKGVHLYRCQQVTIKNTGGMLVHIDGEPLPLQYETSATLAPNKLRIISN